jgi:hypothetical protein
MQEVRKKMENPARARLFEPSEGTECLVLKDSFINDRMYFKGEKVILAAGIKPGKALKPLRDVRGGVRPAPTKEQLQAAQKRTEDSEGAGVDTSAHEQRPTVRQDAKTGKKE